MAEVIDRDTGWKKFKREMFALSKQGAVTVGIQGDEAGQMHEGGITNARLGGVHEFGATIKHPGGTPYIVTDKGTFFLSKNTAVTPTGFTKPHDIVIPERSFLRATVDNNRSKYADLAHKLIGQIVDFKLSAEKALGLLGARIKADVQNSIKRGIAPPNKPETIRRKGSSKPLIDGGELVNSITWQVRDS